MVFERGFNPTFHQALTGARHRIGAGLKRRCDGGVAAAIAAVRFIGFQQNTRPQQLARRMLAFAEHREQLLALLGAQLHRVFSADNLRSQH